MTVLGLGCALGCGPSLGLPSPEGAHGTGGDTAHGGDPGATSAAFPGATSGAAADVGGGATGEGREDDDGVVATSGDSEGTGAGGTSVSASGGDGGSDGGSDGGRDAGGESSTGVPIDPDTPCSDLVTEADCTAASHCTPTIAQHWHRDFDVEGNYYDCAHGEIQMVACNANEDCADVDLACAYDQLLEVYDGCVEIGWWGDDCEPLQPGPCEE